MERLKVSNHIFVLDDDLDTPFLWISDDCWAYLMRFNTSQATQYLNNRQAKGFTVIHCWMPPQWQTTNVNGDSPFSNSLSNTDNTILNNSFWNHVESLLSLAEDRNLYVLIELGKFFTSAMPSNLSLDNWGNQAQRRARSYNVGYRIANRLRQRTNVYFGCGGDFAPDGSKTSDSGSNVQEKIIWMRAGLQDGWANATYNESASSAHNDICPVSMHPGTPQSNPTGSGGNTSDYFSQSELDYNQMQAGRASRFLEYHYEQTAINYALSPATPSLDTESTYEDSIPLDEASFRIRGWHIRAKSYLGLFAGSAGISYGHVSIWQLRQPGYPARGDVRFDWDDPAVLEAEGVNCIPYLSALMHSRPQFSWVPFQALLVTGVDDDYTRLQAIKDGSDRYAMVYTTNGRSFTVDMSAIGGSTARAYWFDPRNGTNQLIGTFATSGTREFDPPGNPSARTSSTGNDWILVLDDAAQGYPPPGEGPIAPVPRPRYVMAHRGGGNGTNGERPENTLPAFRWAWQNKCNPEGDVYLTSDGQVVFIHDATVNRTTNGTGSVDSFTLSQIQQLDAGSWFHSSYAGTRIPSVTEVLTAFAAEAPEGVYFSIDTHDEGATLYNALAFTIGALDLWDRIFLEVSNTSVADALRAVDTRFRFAVWCPNDSALTTALAYEHYERVHMAVAVADRVHEVHQAGKTAIIALGGNDTLNGLCTALNAASEPADGINTNRPRFMREITVSMGLAEA